jgi:DNA end-binding protein Ku
VLDKEVEIKPAELKMASQVVESMTDDCNPDRYHDDYQEQLHELVQSKLEGGEAFAAEERPTELDATEDVSDLLARLEASVKARRSGSGGSDGSDDSDGGSWPRKHPREGRGQEGAREECPGQQGRVQEVRPHRAVDTRRRVLHEGGTRADIAAPR